jgi:hypothetical protein
LDIMDPFDRNALPKEEKHSGGAISHIQDVNLSEVSLRQRTIFHQRA